MFVCKVLVCWFVCILHVCLLHMLSFVWLQLVVSVVGRCTISSKCILIGISIKPLDLSFIGFFFLWGWLPRKRHASDARDLHDKMSNWCHPLPIWSSGNQSPELSRTWFSELVFFLQRCSLKFASWTTEITRLNLSIGEFELHTIRFVAPILLYWIDIIFLEFLIEEQLS